MYYLTIEQGELKAYDGEDNIVFHRVANQDGAELLGSVLAALRAKNWMHSSSLDHPMDNGAPNIDYHAAIQKGYTEFEAAVTKEV